MRNLCRNLAVFLLSVVCFIPYLPLLLFGLTVIVLKCLFLKAKLLTGMACRRTGRVGVVNYKYPVSDITQVADDDELQFLKFRSPLYLYRMTVWCAREIARYLLGYQKFWVISEETLIFMLTHTLYAHSVRYDEEMQMYRMVFEGMENFNLYKNFHWDVREIRFNKEHTKISIILKEDKVVHWPCSDDKLADWKLAKLHAQVGLTFSAPGLSHTHVHFVFPSTTAVITKTVLPANSFLRRLLEPHIRYTERINYQALNINVSTDNSQTFLDKYYYMWKVIPVNKEQFIEGVIKKCHTHYHLEGKKKAHKNSDSQESQHPHFPPPYVQHKKYQELPYLRFLASYYGPVKRFVQSVEHLIDKREWENMSRAMARHVPGIEDVDMVDVLATFIHNAAIVHYCDHIGFALTYGFKYACMEIRYPFESFDNVEVWDELLAGDPNLSYEKVRRNPELLMKLKHVTRTRIFANIFVDYIPDVVHDLSLLAVKYNFDGKSERLAVDAASQFMQELKEVDKALQKEETETLIPGRPRDLNLPQTMQLLPLESFVSTICF